MKPSFKEKKMTDEKKIDDGDLFHPNTDISEDRPDYTFGITRRDWLD